MDKPIKRIEVTENGPYRVYGGIPLVELFLVPDPDGLSIGYRQGRTFDPGDYYELCRCGDSENKPFCDMSHEIFGFDGAETAGNVPYKDQIEQPITTGPALDMTDVVRFCASARFCDRDGGAWDRVRDSASPESASIALTEIWSCPAGRLVALDKHGRPMEPQFEPSIAVIFDQFKDRIGPIWVRGGIPIYSADGTIYEMRNRVTLCRCGHSKNKPFCDGTHVDL